MPSVLCRQPPPQLHNGIQNCTGKIHPKWRQSGDQQTGRPDTDKRPPAVCFESAPRKEEITEATWATESKLLVCVAFLGQGGQVCWGGVGEWGGVWGLGRVRWGDGVGWGGGRQNQDLTGHHQVVTGYYQDATGQCQVLTRHYQKSLVTTKNDKWDEVARGAFWGDWGWRRPPECRGVGGAVPLLPAPQFGANIVFNLLDNRLGGRYANNNATAKQPIG